MARNDRLGLLANIDTEKQEYMLADQINVDIEESIENGYRTYKWYRMRDRDCSDAGVLLRSEGHIFQPQFIRTLKS